MSESVREIEVKLLGLDEEKLEQNLQEAGALFDVTEKQTNLRINSSKHPIADPSYLRIRCIEVEGREMVREFTFKERLAQSEARINVETTVEISDEKALLAILQKMGYDRVEVGTKVRRRYLWQDFRIEFDRWDEESFPYPYVEVEAPNVEALQSFLRTFSIPEPAVSTKSIAELKADWLAKRAF